MANAMRKPKVTLGHPGHAEDMKDPSYRAEFDARGVIHDIALAVRELREAAKMTQAELAARAGTTQQVIGRLEVVGDRVPRLSLLFRVMDALGAELTIKIGSGKRKKKIEAR